MKKTKKIVTCFLAVVIVLSLGVVVAQARDIGYTDPLTFTSNQEKLFTSVSRHRYHADGNMSVNSTAGGTKPGYVQRTNGSPVIASQRYDYGIACSAVNVNQIYAPNGAYATVFHQLYIVDNEDIECPAQSQIATPTGDYYLYLRSSSSALYARVSWCPDSY